MSSFDIVIKNGRIIDGTGNPWFKADVGVKDKKIAKIGKIDTQKATLVIDAKELIVCPGFIDPHNHSDTTVFANSRLESMIGQGITTLICGNCGFSMAPLVEARKEEIKTYLGFLLLGKPNWDWHTVGDFLQKLEKLGIGANFGTLVGHGTVRLGVMGFEDRDPTPNELDDMKKMVEQAMEDGAFGMSSGLGYPPGVFSKTSELIELCKVVAKYGRIYATHMRAGIANLNEPIEIGEKANVPVQISHLGSSRGGISELKGKHKETSLKILEDARAKGIDVIADVYPYNAGSTYLGSMPPRWAQEGGISELLKRIQDPETREKIKREMAGRAWDKTMFVYSPTGKNRELEGKTFVEIGKIKGKDPTEAALEIILDEKGGGMHIGFFGEESDVETLLSAPFACFGTDGWAHAPYGEAHVGKPHPRCYGTYARVIERFVRDLKTLSLEEAIKKSTSLPAQRFKIWDRGLVREGMWADIIIFDPFKIHEVSTYTDPHHYPEGIQYVFVNGTAVVEKGEHNKTLPGMILRAR